jgi:glycosyltransferase involved in cell wall biosynthesis
LFRNHPEYSAIFNVVKYYRKKIRFVLVGKTGNSSGTMILEDDVIACDIQTSGAASLLHYCLGLAKILFKYRPNLTIVLGLQIWPIAIFSFLFSRSKYVPIFIGEFNYYGNKKIGKLLTNLLIRINSASLRLSEGKILDAFALSRYVRDGIEKLAPNLCGKIRLVSYPIAPVFCAVGSVSMPIASVTPTILTVAGIERRKGLDTLIKAISLIPRRLKVIIKGDVRDVSYLQILKRMVEDLSLKNSITFVTNLIDYDALVSYYKSATLFVLPSREDCLGVVLLEALHCNLPVVATSIGGIPDMIENGINGILVKPDDPYELAKAISLLLDDNATRQKISKNAKRTLFNRYYKGRITLEEALNQSTKQLLVSLGYTS